MSSRMRFLITDAPLADVNYEWHLLVRRLRSKRTVDVIFRDPNKTIDYRLADVRPLNCNSLRQRSDFE